MTSEHFEIRYKSTSIKVETLNVKGIVAYRAVFSSNRQPLLLTKATNFNLNDFWTSIPEGRQKEAEGLGKLIDEHFLNKETN